MDTGTAVSTVSSLVSSVGFPIVCVFICLYLIWSMNNKYNTQTEKWMEIITNNTAALNALIGKLEGDSE